MIDVQIYLSYQKSDLMMVVLLCDCDDPVHQTFNNKSLHLSWRARRTVSPGRSKCTPSPSEFERRAAVPCAADNAAALHHMDRRARSQPRHADLAWRQHRTYGEHTMRRRQTHRHWHCRRSGMRAPVQRCSVPLCTIALSFRDSNLILGWTQVSLVVSIPTHMLAL